MRKAINKAVTVGLCLSILSAHPINADTVYDVPINNNIKTYMGYKAISNKRSRQWALQTEAVSDANGLRVRNGRYLVAIGSGYNAPVGTDIDVLLDTGVVLPCTVGDMKGDQHTDPTNRWAVSNNNVLEFIVDSSSLNRVAANRGDIGAIPGYEGQVKSINVLGATNEVTFYSDPEPAIPEVVVESDPEPVAVTTPTPTLEPTSTPESEEEKITPTNPHVTVVIEDSSDNDDEEENVEDMSLESRVDHVLDEVREHIDEVTYGVPASIAGSLQDTLDKINETEESDDFEVEYTTTSPVTMED